MGLGFSRLTFCFSQFDISILGLGEESKKAAAALAAPKSIHTPSASVATPHTQLPNGGATPAGNISSASVSPAVMERPQRASRRKRRKYDDNSFEGYGDGYEDEDAEDYAGEEGAKKRKKRKKVRIVFEFPSFWGMSC